jgi:hypothetical protein
MMQVNVTGATWTSSWGGDSIYDIAMRVKPAGYPISDADYVKAFIHVNQALLEKQGIDPDDDCVPLPANLLLKVVYLNPGDNSLPPEVSPADAPFDEAEAMANYLNTSGYRDREKFFAMAKSEHAANIAACSMLMRQASNNLKSHASGLAAAGAVLSGQAGDYVKEGSERLAKRMEGVQSALSQYHRTGLAADKTAFLEQHKVMNEELNHYIQKVSKRLAAPSLRSMRFINSAEDMLMADSAVPGGMPLMDTWGVKELFKVVKTAKFVGKGFVVLEIAVDGYEVYDSYRDGGEWVKELVEDTVGFFAGYGFGWAAMVFCSPIGWVVVVPIALATVGVDMSMQDLMKTILKDK